jgi:peptidoglycan/LPS O-acetylase OafA/YrhL
MLGIYIVLNFNSEDVAAAITGIAIFIVVKTNRMNTLLISPFIQWSGKISYSLYITHWLTGLKFIDFVKERVLLGKIGFSMAIGLYLGTLIIIFSTAYLFYRWVEEPSHRLSKNLFKSANQDALRLKQKVHL